MSTIGTCPACGYPRIGAGLCAFCVPVQALSGHQDFLSAPRAGQPRFCPGRAWPVAQTKPEAAESTLVVPAG